MDPEIVAALIGPMVTALLAAGSVTAKALRDRRNQAQARSREIELASQTVKFIDTWLAAQAKLPPHPGAQQRIQQALADLDRAYATMLATVEADRRAPADRVGLNALRRMLLLPLQRPGAKAVRIIYYLVTAMALLFVAAGISVLVEDQDDEHGLLVSIMAAAIISVACLLPSVGLYFLARALDRPRAEDSSALTEGAGLTPPGATAYYGPGLGPAPRPDQYPGR